MKALRTLLTTIAALAALTATAQDFTVETIYTMSGNPINITLIKHGSLTISYQGYEIEVDPVGRYTDYSLMPKADLIVVAHEHGDHLDPKAIEAVSKEGTKLFINQRGFDQIKKGEVLANGDTRQVTPLIKVEAVPAYNITPENLQKHPKGVGNGYVFTIDGRRIYVAGDTENIPELAQIKNIDVAFLPVNRPTMTIDQAVEAALIIKPRVLIPYHHGDTPVEQIKQKLDAQASGIDVRIRDMQ